MNGKNALRPLLSKTSLTMASAFMLAFLFAPHSAFAFTEVFDPIDTNTTWTQSGSPYIIYDFIEVEPGITLTIEPGVVVKAEEGAEFSVAGTLNANGTEAEPIYFTSIKDDEVGGDTNGDGSDTTPSSGDWVHIGFTPGANGSFTYTTIRYGGFVDAGPGPGPGPSPFTGIYNDGATVSLSYVSIIDNGEEGLVQINGGNTTAEYLTVSDHYAHGIFVDSGIMTVDHATIQDNGTGVYAESFFDIPTVTITNSEITGNTNGIISFGAALSVNNSSIHDNTLTGLRNSNSGLIDATNNWWGDASGPTTPQNPGGTGDSITYGVFGTGNGSNPSDAVDFDPWLSADPLLELAEPDPVIVIPGILGSAFKNGVWTLDPIKHVYDNLVETLVGNGYIYDQTVFTFPYNWTQSNELTAEELKEKIDEVKVQTGATHVDLVAHSMGGLVARQYIQSPEYENDVDQLIFLGTPQLGAPLAYLMYEGGEIDITNAGDILMDLYLSHLAREAGFDDLFSYLHLGNVESVKQLLPIYDYLFNSSNQLLDYPNGYPTNPFLENLDTTSSQLSLSDVEVTNIIGDDEKNKTVNSLDIEPSSQLPLWLHGNPTNLNRGAGDGTVPLFSAAPSFLDSSTTFVSDHASLPTEAEGLVYSILTGNTATFLADVPLIERFLVLRAFSPIDIQIIAPSGARMGKDFDTGQELEEIPGAFYSGFDTNVEYVVIPNPEDGQYVINVQGTDGGGTYTLSTSYIDNIESTEINVSSTIVSGATTQVIATLDTVSDEPVVVEQSLNDLIAHLKTVISDLDASEKQKNQLLKKVEKIEKKIEKRINKQSKMLDKLNLQIKRKADKGKIDADAAADISALLDDLIESSAMVPLDQEILTDLKDQINALDVKLKLKNSLLKKIQRLENLAALNRSLMKMISAVERKENKGKISEDDAENVLNILEQIQEAL